MPSLRSSAWIRGAPQRGFPAAMRQTSALISALTGGRPPEDPPERFVQYSRTRRRCHRRTVSGVTITRDALQPADSGQANPEEAVTLAESRAGHRALVDGELLPQGEVLEGELAMAAEEGGEKPKQLEQECNHRANILSGSEARTQPLGRRMQFWRGTVFCR